MSMRRSGQGNTTMPANTMAMVLRVCTILGLVVVVGRVAQLQLAPSEDLQGFISARTTVQPLPAVRGDLLDRRGRVLATTRAGFRVVVDPTTVIQGRNTSVEQVIVALSDALDLPADQVGARIMGALIENSKRAAEASNAQGSGSSIASLSPTNTTATKVVQIRYLPIGETITQQQADAIQSLNLPGVSLEHRPERVQTAPDIAGSLVGKVGYEDRSTRRVGKIGAEMQFQSQLEGTDGSLTYVRDSQGRPLWVQRGRWIDSNRGSDVRLSIDLELQRIVHEELAQGVERADAAGGRAIMLDPNTGEVLAMVDVLRETPDAIEFPWDDDAEDAERTRYTPLDPMPRYRLVSADPAREMEAALAHNRCVRDVYEPGSTFKPFVWTLAKSEGLLPDDEVIKLETNYFIAPDKRRLQDVTYQPEMTWVDVLKYSSNIGMSIASDRVPQDKLRKTVDALRFGHKTGLGFPGESPGIVTPESRWSVFTQTSVGMGYEIAVTPVQMVRAFSIFARAGDNAGTLPEVRFTAAGRDGRPGLTGDEIMVERVFPSGVVRQAIEPMRAVAERMDTRTRREDPTIPVARYSMFGKSGTANIPGAAPEGKRRPQGTPGYFKTQYNTSFIAAVPAQDPRVVILVVIDDPGPRLIAAKRHFGAWSAGPVVRRVVERAMPYLGVEADLSPDETQTAMSSATRTD
ncbi:MAG: penicillin-binding protein 2 [Phycisphaerales bacterium]|nr:penicillin-binding protein 2 [Phycisphaerales bacterium]